MSDGTAIFPSCASRQRKLIQVLPTLTKNDGASLPGLGGQGKAGPGQGKAGASPSPRVATASDWASRMTGFSLRGTGRHISFSARGEPQGTPTFYQGLWRIARAPCQD